MTEKFLIYLFLASFLIFLVPAKFKYHVTAFVLSFFIFVTSADALAVLSSGLPLLGKLGISSQHTPWHLTLDSLSAFFTLVINFTLFTGIIYAGSYLKNSTETKTPLQLSLHFFAFLWLGFAMFLILALRTFFPFLIAWELMTIASFILVVFDAEKKEVLKAGIHYLLQMHIGFLLIMSGFLIAGIDSGDFSFSGLSSYFSSHQNWPLFLVFFAGFGIKAGFIPFHSWLPDAHPAAPSHISGIMSGVMIKMGIFGILRVITLLTGDFQIIGMIILSVSLISGLLGVMLAIVQHDIKRLLAYHSIENIGIIGIGMGLGVLGMYLNNQLLVFLGFSGALLHVLNHSLFKSMLFYNAGVIYKAIHTRNIDSMGGLIRKMPVSAYLFLFAALAITGLPPLNGFISEFLIYSGMFNALTQSGFYGSLIFLFSILGLTLIGGLALFCFTKAFGIIYLGQQRAAYPADLKESDSPALLSQIIILAAILFIGFGASLLMPVTDKIVSGMFAMQSDFSLVEPTIQNLNAITVVSYVFVLSLALLFLIRKLLLRKRTVTQQPTWGCGYTAGNSKQQYTASSFADNYADLAKPLIGGHAQTETLSENDYFPAPKTFKKHFSDFIAQYLISVPVSKFTHLLKKSAQMQTGQLQHYILYAFIFILMVFALTYLNLI